MENNLKSKPKYLSPDAWVQEINDRVLTPYVKPEQIVVDKETLDEFDSLETRAHAHALARGEHDALLYLHIYAIWNASLWRARYDSWEDYCDEWDRLPMGVSKSSIKHKVADIKKLLTAGVTIDVIVKTLGNIPMATRALMGELIEDGEDGNKRVNRAFYEKMPNGGDVNKYLEELAELGPVAAGLVVDEFIQRPAMYFDGDAEYDKATKRILFTVVSKDGNKVIKSEMYVANVPEWAERFLRKKLSGRY